MKKILYMILAMLVVCMNTIGYAAEGTLSSKRVNVFEAAGVNANEYDEISIVQVEYSVGGQEKNNSRAGTGEAVKLVRRNSDNTVDVNVIMLMSKEQGLGTRGSQLTNSDCPGMRPKQVSL